MKTPAIKFTLGIPFFMGLLIVLKALKLIELSWIMVFLLPLLVPLAILLFIFLLFLLALIVVALLGGSNNNKWRH